MSVGDQLDNELSALCEEIDVIAASMATLQKDVSGLRERVALLEMSPSPEPPAYPPLPPITRNGLQQTFYWPGARVDGLEKQDFKAGSLYLRFNVNQLSHADRASRNASPESLVNLEGFSMWARWARDLGVKLSFRVMMLNSDGAYWGPTWMRDIGWRGTEFTWNGIKQWVPDHGDTNVRAFFESLYGQIADKHMDVIDMIDAHGFGLWGEWHYNNADGSQAKPLDPVDDFKWSIDLLDGIFPDKHKLVTLKRLSDHRNAALAARYAIDQGWGFRFDAAGDPWSNQVYYPDAMRDMRAMRAVGTVPIACEPSGTFNQGNWAHQQSPTLSWWNILEGQIDRWNVTHVNNKGDQVSPPHLDTFRRLLTKINANGQALQG